MEEPTEFQDWELLHGSDSSDSSFISTLDSKAFEGIEGDSSEGAIKSDYFALDSDKLYITRTTASEEDSEDADERSLGDSDNPSWVDPESDSRYLDRPKGELGFAGIGFPCKNSGGFWSDASSDGQRSSPSSEKRELCNVGFQEIEAEHQNSGGDDSDAKEEVGFGGIGETEGIEIEKPDELDSASLVEKSTGNGSSGNHCVGEGDKRGMVWWKKPLELLKLFVFRVRPVWSISIAAAIMGFVMLGRKLYKMKHKTRSIPLKVSIDEKVKASQFMVRAARLNEAFSVVRRVPIIRASLPTGGVTPWPVVSLR